MKYCRLLLLIGTLLACPFRCMHLLACDSDQDVAAHVQTCSCCSHQGTGDEPAPASNHSPSPLSDSCCHCLCDGAVPSVEKANLELLQSIDLLASEILLQEYQQVAGVFRTDGLVGGIEFQQGKEELCLLNCVLLI